METREQIQQREEAEMAGVKGGLGVYIKNSCQTCHGADRAGGLVGKSLLNIGAKLNFKDFNLIVTQGKGLMPAQTNISKDEINILYKFLKGNSNTIGPNENKADANKLDPEILVLPEGPVVASGGATSGKKMREVLRINNRWGSPYPAGVDSSLMRYYSEGWGLGYPFIIPPPWSEIIAYDLNKGTIKWKVPLGKSAGGENTGIPGGSQRRGMIVTSTGIVFCTSKDEKIYAFDADNGKELWAGKLPKGTEGLPAVYEVNGRTYLVVNSTTPTTLWGLQKGAKIRTDTIVPPGGYVVYSLPQ